MRIIKNKINKLVFTLNEKTTIPNANYFLQLFSNSDKSNTIIPLSNEQSFNVNRYNQFNITEGPIEDLTNLIVNLNGTYDYFVHQSSATTVNIDDKNIIESGKLYTVDLANSATTYNTPTDGVTFI